MEKESLLRVKDLVVHYETHKEVVEAVNNVSFERYVPKKDASSESAGGGGGTDDRPGEL